MKKNGFTLAEVLITLAIIGVVATLTLPALMTNTAEQQAKTALKKGAPVQDGDPEWLDVPVQELAGRVIK